ncbi:MAG: glucuronate isomerase [Clostridiales bacterium]|nr:glucuronate isomerase [Clostridiales bacterium]
MKEFMGKDFLLNNPTAVELYHEAAAKMPIFDWHCHLSPQEIYENKQPADIAQLWLAGDHYKWRAMRSYGIAEEYITGKASGYDKFKAWAKAMPYLVGNPLYHWTHLELQRYFDIYEPLSEDTADDIWQRANAKIAAGGFKPRDLIVNSGVTHVFTTDDSADSLEYHKLLAEDKSFSCRVLPAFRPDKALAIDLPGYLEWLQSLEDRVGRKIETYGALTKELKGRIEFFAQMGCRASDHAFAYMPYEPADENELEKIFAKALEGKELTIKEADKYKTELMRVFAKEYARLGWGMEIHIGAMRNNNKLMFERLGPDTGYDSIADHEIAHKLSRFLDSLAYESALPRTVLFTLNPKDNYVLGTMLGNFQNDEAASKIQLGTAWWFNDNLDGMREQMKTLANTGVFGKFIGMVTDSRSLLSYPRHEYFRRILCAFIGDMVDQGLYPYDRVILEKIVKDISYNNAIDYFGL